MGTPHDIFVHAMFREPRQAAAWLRTILPRQLVARLDWDTLRRLGERVHGRGLHIGAADLVFAVRFAGTERRLLLVVEHRSFAGVGLHDALLRYAVHLARAAGRGGDEEVGPAAVFAVALYHGAGEADLRSRVEVDFPPEERGLLLPWQPRIRIAVDDLTARSEAEILARPLLPRGLLAQLAVRFLPHLDAVGTIEALHRWGPLLRAVDGEDRTAGEGDAIEQFGWYLLHVNDTPAEDVHMALEKNLQRREENFMSTAEKLRREGKAEGRAATLLRLLARRFGPLPPHVEPRLRRATVEELDQFTDRVLDAPTLEAVFAPLR